MQSYALSFSVLVVTQPWVSYSWDAASWDEEQCFDNAIPKDERVDIEYQEQKSPLKILRLAWTLSRVNAELASIVLEEKVGFNVDRNLNNEEGCCSWFAVRATVPGCVPAANKSLECNPDQPGHPFAHLSFEAWRSYIPNGFDSYTESLGLDDQSKPIFKDLSYQAAEGVCVRPDLNAHVLKATGYDISYFRFYDVSFFNVSRFFSTTAEVDAIAGKSPLACDLRDKRVTNFQGSHISTYLDLTGDVDGVVVQPDNIGIAKCQNGWWFAPACRSKPSSCIPAITMNSWLVSAMMQRAVFYNMPLAIGTYDVDEKATVVYKIVDEAAVLFYETMHLPQYSGLSQVPNKLLFPLPPDVEDLNMGVFRTALQRLRVGKVAWRNLRHASKRASIFFDQYDLYQQEVGIIGIRALRIGVRKAACEWLRHSRQWEKWLPPPPVECPAGTEVGIGNQCDNCSQGYFSPEGGTEARCLPCGTGSYQNLQGQSFCGACAYGSFNNQRGASQCLQCIPGRFAEREGMWSCQNCPRGRYNPVPAQAICAVCPRGADCHSVDDNTGAVDFVAKEDYYLLGNVTPVLSQMNFNEGINPDSDSGFAGYGPYRCPVSGTCLGNNSCIEGMEGPLCSSCSRGYERADAQKRCGACPSNFQSWVLIILVLLGIYVCLYLMEQMSYVNAGNLSEVGSIVFKILYSFFIQLSIIAKTTQLGALVDELTGDVNLQAVLSPVLAALGLGKALENPAVSLLSVSCMLRFMTSELNPVYFNALLAIILVPCLLLLFGLFMSMGVLCSMCYASYMRNRTPETWQMYRSNFVSRLKQGVGDRFPCIAVMVLYFLHPMVSSYALSVFDCDDFDEDTELALDTFRLRIDAVVDCNSSEWYRWATVACLSILIWSLGIPLFLGLLLRYVRGTLGLHATRSHHRYGFLFQGFEDECYYYETIFMLRRFVYLAVASAPWLTIDCRTVVLLALSLILQSIRLEDGFDDRAYRGLDRLESWSQITLIYCLVGRCFQLMSEQMIGDFWSGSSDEVPPASKLAYLPSMLCCWVFLSKGIYLLVRQAIWPLERDSTLPTNIAAFLDRRLHVSLMPLRFEEISNDTHAAEHTILGSISDDLKLQQRNRGTGLSTALKAKERELFKRICTEIIEVLLQRHELSLQNAPEVISLPTFMIQFERVFVGCYITALINRLDAKILYDKRDTWMKWFKGVASDMFQEANKIATRGGTKSFDTTDVKAGLHSSLNETTYTLDKLQTDDLMQEALKPLSAEELQLALMTITPSLLEDSKASGETHLQRLASRHQELLDSICSIAWIFSEEQHRYQLSQRALAETSKSGSVSEAHSSPQVEVTLPPATNDFSAPQEGIQRTRELLMHTPRSPWSPSNTPRAADLLVLPHRRSPISPDVG